MENAFEWHDACIREFKPMKTPLLYNLIVESEDKNRMVAETVIYALLILSAIASILHAAVQPVVMPFRTVAAQATIEYRG
jgi:hypothetical protein